MRRIFAVAFVVLFAGEMVAADALVPSAIPLTKPRKSEPRGGGPLDKVEIAIWLPEGAKVVRGAIVNPFYVKAAEQKHWQEAARLWDFAVIGANYSSVATVDYPTLLTALKETGEKTNHSELANLPFLFVGMSAGAGMSMKFAELYPERTIAVAPVCLEAAPTTPATRKIPVCTVFGEKDGGQMKLITAKHPEQRKEGAAWSIAVQWGRAHEFALANNLVLPFFDDVIRGRYPAHQSPLEGLLKLLDYPETSVWFGDTATWGKNVNALITPAAMFTGDKEKSCWLPGARTAHTWAAFVGHSRDLKITTPPGQGDGQPFVLHESGKPLVVQAETAGGDKKITKVELFDGDTRLGEKNAAPYEFETKLASGIHPLIVVASIDGTGTIRSRPHTIIVGRKQ